MKPIDTHRVIDYAQGKGLVCWHGIEGKRWEAPRGETRLASGTVHIIAIEEKSTTAMLRRIHFYEQQGFFDNYDAYLAYCNRRNAWLRFWRGFGQS